MVAKSLTIPGTVTSKEKVTVTYVIKNEGAGETDRSWWIDEIVSHKNISIILICSRMFLLRLYFEDISFNYVLKMLQKVNLS